MFFAARSYVHLASAAFALWSLRPARRADALQQLAADVTQPGGGVPRLSSLLGVCRELERRGASEAEVDGVRRRFARLYPRATAFAAPSSPATATKVEP